MTEHFFIVKLRSDFYNTKSFNRNEEENRTRVHKLENVTVYRALGMEVKTFMTTKFAQKEIM